VDLVDAAMLRELWRGGSLGMVRHDPRLSVNALSRAIGLDRSSVRDRLQRWRDEGFIARFHAVPNPSLFGYIVTGSGIRVDDPRQKEAARKALDQTEESFAIIDHAGPWIGVASICSSMMHARTVKSIYARLPGVDEATPLFHSAWPQCQLALTALDWRLIQAIHHDPEGSLQVIAADLHVNASTVTRRYDRLVKGSALMVTPDLDFTNYTNAALMRLLIHMEQDSDPAAIARAFRARPETIVAYSLNPEGGAPFIDVYAHLSSPGMAGRIELEARSLDGVTETEVLWPRDHRVSPDVLDAHLKRALAASQKAATRTP